MRILKKVLLLVGIAFAALVVLPILGFLVFAFAFRPRVAPAANLAARNDAETVERGRYLATNVYQCVWCHSPADREAPGQPIPHGKELAGREWKETSDDPSFHLRAPNVSASPAGISNWTDGELVRAMREGIRKDGTAIFEFMPYTTFHDKMSDADALAIVSYLRAAPPQADAMPASEIPFIGVVIGGRLPPMPVATPYPGPPAEAGKERGDWLLSVALCHWCHDSQSEDGGPPMDRVPLAGGGKVVLPSGASVRIPNISSDPTKGIGAYSDADIVNALDGVGKNGQPLRGMPWTAFKGLTAGDKQSIVAALRASAPTQ